MLLFFFIPFLIGAAVVGGTAAAVVSHTRKSARNVTDSVNENLLNQQKYFFENIKVVSKDFNEGLKQNILTFFKEADRFKDELFDEDLPKLVKELSVIIQQLPLADRKPIITNFEVTKNVTNGLLAVTFKFYGYSLDTDNDIYINFLNKKNQVKSIMTQGMLEFDAYLNIDDIATIESSNFEVPVDIYFSIYRPYALLSQDYTNRFEVNFLDINKSDLISLKAQEAKQDIFLSKNNLVSILSSLFYSFCGFFFIGILAVLVDSFSNLNLTETLENNAIFFSIFFSLSFGISMYSIKKDLYQNKNSLISLFVTCFLVFVTLVILLSI